MGSSHSQLGGQLAPQERPLGLYKDFCVPNQVTVIIRASIKSWSGVSHPSARVLRTEAEEQNEYVVRDTSGVPVIKISGKALSVGNKKRECMV